MKKSGNKIIIRPRRTQQPEPVSEPEPEPSEPTTEQDVEANEDNEQVEDAPPDSDAPEGSVKDVDNTSAIESDDGNVTPSTRGRGRPRGRPRGSGTGRPRGRPRGSGRGRGRPKTTGRGPLTLRLPRRGSASDGEDAGDGEDSRGTPAEDEPAPSGKTVRIGGETYVIEGDAYKTDDDPKGDTKIDQNGVLLGGRQFKAQTFVLPDRHPERRYMLAIDAARTSGFRDSLYYFRRNPLALKLIASQPEKDFLIEIGKLGGHLRTRSVTLVTARSAFKLHGSKTLIDGKIGIDDYFEEKAIAEAAEKGLKPGDPASELIEQAQAATAEASAAALAKSGGGSKGERSGLGIYRTGGPTTVFGGSGLGPYSDGPLHVAKKAMLTREGVSEENWTLVMAQRTRETNSEWTRGRAEAIRGLTSDYGDSSTDGRAEGEDATVSRNKRQRRSDVGTGYGVYEPHTTIIHYERSTQPTSARWEVVPDSTGARRVLGGSKAGNGAWGLAWVDTVMEYPNRKDEDEQEIARRNLLQSIIGLS